MTTARVWSLVAVARSDRRGRAGANDRPSRPRPRSGTATGRHAHSPRDTPAAADTGPRVPNQPGVTHHVADLRRASPDGGQCLGSPVRENFLYSFKEAKRRRRRRWRYGAVVAVAAFVAWDPPRPRQGPHPLPRPLSLHSRREAPARLRPASPPGDRSIGAGCSSTAMHKCSYTRTATRRFPTERRGFRSSIDTSPQRASTASGPARSHQAASSRTTRYRPICGADPEFTIYAPSHYAACPHIDQWSLDLTTAQGMLPAPVQELLQGTQRTYASFNPAFPEWTLPPGECFTLPTREARNVVQVADDYHVTRANALDHLARGGGPDVRFIAADGTVVGLHITPVMPDGQASCGAAEPDETFLTGEHAALPVFLAQRHRALRTGSRGPGRDPQHRAPKARRDTAAPDRSHPERCPCHLHGHQRPRSSSRTRVWRVDPVGVATTNQRTCERLVEASEEHRGGRAYPRRAST